MDPMLVRIFDVDFYMSSPVQNLDVTFSNFRGTAIYQVPVMRIFGSTINGEKICVHVHGVFPYFYIPYDGTEQANALMHKISCNIDRALNVSLGQASSEMQYVYKISLVSGVPYYGYHSKKHQFFKIYLYNPIFIKRINNLLFNESVLGGKVYQPHEMHLNFTLQFMIDYNLHGMSNVAFSEVKFRKSVNSMDTNEDVLEKVSSCALECDVLSEHILNRKEVESGSLVANPGISALWEDERQRRRNKNESSQLPHYLSLERTNIPPTESHEIFKEALRQRLELISQEDIDKTRFNFSVYPAETPRNKRMENCSQLDFHSPLSLEKSSNNSELFETTLNETLNVTLDEDMQNLVEVLKDLERKDPIEEDSVLSQVSRKNNNYEDEKDDETFENANLLDETIKLTQICEQTPVKLKIPQLDGNCNFDELDFMESLDNVLNIDEQEIVEKTKKVQNTNSHQIVKDLKQKELSANNPSKLMNSMNMSVIQSLLDKEHDYFCVDSIGERVAKKNQAERRKEKLRQQLEQCRNVIVLIEKCNRMESRGRDMPDLNSNDFPQLPEFDQTIIYRNISQFKRENDMNKRRCIFQNKREKLMSKKKDMIFKKGTEKTVLLRKIFEKILKDFKLLNAGLKPTFRIVAGHTPYIYRAKFKTPLIKPANRKINFEDLLKAQKENEKKFFSSLKTTTERHVINERKILQNSRNVKKNNYLLFLDGANDDRDDEVRSDGGSKSTKKGKMRNNYAALPITVRRTSSSSASSKKGISNVAVNEQTNTKTWQGDDFVEKSITSNNIQRIKRKINFQEDIDETKIEEETICQLKPSYHQTNIVEQFGNDDYENSSNSSETFLPTSTWYDIINDFNPQEGCSKFIERSSDFSATFVVEKSSIPSKTHSDDICDPYEKPSSQTYNYYKPQYKPPTSIDIELNLNDYNIPKTRSIEPFYSDPKDATGPLDVGFNVLKIKTLTTSDLPDFQSDFIGIKEFRENNFKKDLNENPRYFYSENRPVIIKPVKKPPTRAQVENWIKSRIDVIETDKKTKKQRKNTSKGAITGNCGYASEDSLDLTLTPLTPVRTPESSKVTSDNDTSDTTLTPTSTRSSKRGRRKKIDRVTLRKSAILSCSSSENSGMISFVSLNNTYGFKNSIQNYQNCKVGQRDPLSIFIMELHANTRSELQPDPEYDEINAIFYNISNENCKENIGVFMVTNHDFEFNCKTHRFETELELIENFVQFVVKTDPDILLGYEIQTASWGYLIERSLKLNIKIIQEISRIKDKNLKYEKDNDLRVTGRVVLDFWRLLRHEIALQSYTVQNVIYELLHVRIPEFSHKSLSEYWNMKIKRYFTVNYYVTILRHTMKLLEQLDLIGRTSELARLFGIQFFEVLSRGSQFRVESMMFRLAKPLNYVAVSPSVQQRAKMKAPEHIALVLEPESKLYTDPVIVLDFQSLYPSIIIAYNYCFSTCIGRVELLGKNNPFEFGATNLRVTRERVQYLLKKNQLNFSPCGVGFVKKSVRDGILPRMLREILDTRLMVKKSMKENKDDSNLQKVLHNRQLGLKLIANVTYGYTSANFSGRMPAVELGDSIVSKARETLQRAIALVDGNREWNVRVVYGDTDSLFVHCPGKTRKEAFEIGEKIVAAVGEMNPDPVKLKLEKVYQPCILQTKKRYVGYMYESNEQTEPVYDAKGIETVRRDGCPAVSKMLEKCLRIIFETKDVSKVKNYCLKQFNKIITGRISMQELTFAKEFRGFTGYKPGACVPSLELARKWVAVDKRAEPRRGERVPYVIINGPPGLPLIRLVRSPHDVLNDPALRLNALYYITRVIIPPLNRCFNLIGADIHQWFHEMPRKQLKALPFIGGANSPTKKSTISQYFVSTLCIVCGHQTLNGICENCMSKQQETVIVLNEKIRKWETSYNDCKLICSTCTQIIEEPKCISLNCPVLYKLSKTKRDLQQTDHVRTLLQQNFEVF